jgi:hypothetical protein
VSHCFVVAFDCKLQPNFYIRATWWHTLLMQRTFKTRYFSRWMRKSGLTDSMLCQAVAEMVRGLIDADLGGGVVKKRVALPGCGKSGGARTLLATNRGDRWLNGAIVDGSLMEICHAHPPH